MKQKLIVISLIVISLALGLTQGQVRAEETVGLGIVPKKVDFNDPTGSWFVYELKPGETVNDQAAIVNLYPEPAEISVYPVDATTTKEGVFTLKGKNEARDSVGKFVSGLPSSVNLGAKERQIVDFSLTVPEDVEPGDYLGGLVVEKKINEEETSGVGVVGRSGVRIYLTVPGEVKKTVEIVEAKKIKQEKEDRIILKLRNTGNVRLEEMLVKITLKSKWGFIPDSKASYPQPGVLFPQKEVELSLPWKNSNPAIGQFEAEIEVLFNEGLKVNKTISFWMIDYLKLGITIVVLIACLLLLVLYIKGGKKRREKRKERKLKREQNKKLRKMSKGGVGVDGLEAGEIKEILREVVREELERLVVDGKINVSGRERNGKSKRFVNPPGIRMPRGVHSQEVAQGVKKRFFFAKKKLK